MQIDRDKQDQGSFVTILVFSFLLIAVCFFINTVFFNAERKMVYPRYIPENKKIGNDFLLDYRFGERYFVEKKSAYIGDDPENWYTQNAYPPLFTLFLYPLYRFGISYLGGYYFLAGLILLSFIWMVIILPYFFHKRKTLPPVTTFVLTTGIMSYGMQFALERGQFDMICIAICLTSVVIFWYFPKLRWLSYILFILAFQFKVYPFIFIFCFIENWRVWKKNLLRLGGICTGTFLSLFVMGINGFFEFLKALGYQNTSGAYPRDHGFNYGIDYLIAVFELNLKQRQITFIKVGVVVFGLLLLLAILYISLKRADVGLYPPLLMACMLSAMVLFPASKDYKLGLLSGVFVLYVLYLEKQVQFITKKRGVLVHLLFVLIGMCYSAVLFSEAYRPLVLKNSFPILYAMFIVVVVIEFVLYIKTDKNTNGFVTNSNIQIGP